MNRIQSFLIMITHAVDVYSYIHSYILFLLFFLILSFSSFFEFVAHSSYLLKPPRSLASQIYFLLHVQCMFVLARWCVCVCLTVPPRFTTDEAVGDLIVREGSKAELVCNASGIPSPTITWSRKPQTVGQRTESEFCKESSSKSLIQFHPFSLHRPSPSSCHNYHLHHPNLACYYVLSFTSLFCLYSWISLIYSWIKMSVFRLEWLRSYGNIQSALSSLHSAMRTPEMWVQCMRLDLGTWLS